MQAQCLGIMNFTELASVPSDRPIRFTDQLRLAVAAYLARFKGCSREHTESDLRCNLIWCAGRDLDPLAARRPHLELYIRWMQEVRRFKPSTVSRRFSVAAGFYKTCVVDGLLEHSPACAVIKTRVAAVPFSYDDRVTTSPVRRVVLRNGVDIEDPLRVVLGFAKAPGRFDVGDPSRPASFGEPDLRLANRGGARISAAQIAAILERRPVIERALRAITPGASLSAEANSVPWVQLRELFGAFADIRGVGLAKMTKALYPKRPALIPMLDSMVQNYLRDDDLGVQAPFAERALGFVGGYQRDLDRNRTAIRAVRQELARCGYGLTEVRILDLLILSTQAAD
jgi:hypothetical protein